MWVRVLIQGPDFNSNLTIGILGWSQYRDFGITGLGLRDWDFGMGFWDYHNIEISGLRDWDFNYWDLGDFEIQGLRFRQSQDSPKILSEYSIIFSSSDFGIINIEISEKNKNLENPQSRDLPKILSEYSTLLSSSYMRIGFWDFEIINIRFHKGDLWDTRFQLKFNYWYFGIEILAGWSI